jgi:hypothetical protein
VGLVDVVELDVFQLLEHECGLGSELDVGVGQ